MFGIVPTLVKGAQTPGRQPGTARPGWVQGQGIRWMGWKLRKPTLSWQPLKAATRF